MNNSAVQSKRSSKLKQIAVTAVFAALTAVLAQVSVPLPVGVPITLQVFAAALCGYVLGSGRGAAALGIYIILGAVGIPVFSNFTGGVGVIFGKTGGFIWGFPVLAALCGAARQRKMLNMALSALGLIVCYLSGAAQFSFLTSGGFAASLTIFIPFFVKDAAMLAAAWLAGRKLRRYAVLNF